MFWLEKIDSELLALKGKLEFKNSNFMPMPAHSHQSYGFVIKTNTYMYIRFLGYRIPSGGVFSLFNRDVNFNASRLYPRYLKPYCPQADTYKFLLS